LPPIITISDHWPETGADLARHSQNTAGPPVVPAVTLVRYLWELVDANADALAQDCVWFRDAVCGADPKLVIRE